MDSSNNELPKCNPFDNKLRVLYMNKVQEYNNLNRTAGKMDQIHDTVPSTNTEIVRYLELGLLEAQLLDKKRIQIAKKYTCFVQNGCTNI